MDDNFDDFFGMIHTVPTKYMYKLKINLKYLLSFKILSMIFSRWITMLVATLIQSWSTMTGM
jgi:hypothetical protein